MVLFILMLLAFTAPWQDAGDNIAAASRSGVSSDLRLAVYPGKADNQPPGFEFEVLAGKSPLAIQSKTPLSPADPLLIIIDPRSWPPAEMRRHLDLLGRALSGLPGGCNSMRPIRLGFPLLDGILTETLTCSAALTRELETAVLPYLPESIPASAQSPGRTADLIAELIRRAEGKDRIDCLIVAKDREFSEPGADYLIPGLERRFLELSARAGTTIHGYLEGDGILRRICLATGGIVIQASEGAVEPIRQLLEPLPPGFLLAVPRPEGVTAARRLPLSIRLRDGRGVGDVRGPKATWVHPDAVPAPDYRHMRQGLDWLRRAAEAEQEENLTVARSFARNAIREDPWNPDGPYLAIRTSAALQDDAAAEDYLAALIRFQPAAEKNLLLYGSMMRKLDRAAEALGGFQASLAAGAVLTPALRLQRARLLAAAGQKEEARQDFQEILGTDAESPRARAELGRLLLALGDHDGAEEQLRTALSKDPENAVALTGTSEAALGRGDAAKALAFALRAVQADSQDPECRAQLGRTYAARADWKNAEENLRAAVNLSPNRPDLAFSLADACAGAGRYAEGIKALREILERRPHDTGIYRKLSELHVRSGSLADAVAALEWGAARAGNGAAALFKEAAELRERTGEYGQSLLNYRAMIDSADRAEADRAADRLRPHLAFLALWLDADGSFERLPVGKELGLPGPPARAALPAELKHQGDAGGKKPGMPIPGGTAMLAKALGLEESSLKEKDAAAHIFASVLQAGPIGDDKLESNPLRKSAVAVLRDYQDFIRHLEKRKLIPSAPGRTGELKLVFPLAGDKEVLSRTSRFLSFFGVKCRRREDKDGNVSFELDVSPSERAARRRLLLRYLGSELLERNRREVEFTLRQEEVPLVPDLETWDGRILERGKQGAADLLERMLLSTRALRLYLALASCSEAARDTILRTVPTQDLLVLTDTLAVFGRSLEVRDGELVFPGSREAWVSLLGSHGADTGRMIAELLRMGGGRAIATYDALSLAPPSARQHFAGKEGSLRRLFENLEPLDRKRLAAANSGHARQDLSRILRRLSFSGDGVTLGVDKGFAGLVLPAGRQEKGPPPGDGREGIRLDGDGLSRLIEPGGPNLVSSFRPIDMIEFLQVSQAHQPESWSPASAGALSEDPASAPVLVDLIGDIRPPADLMARYFSYGRMLNQTRSEGWNVRRIRTSQAVFYLLSLLRREERIDEEKSRRLLASALTAMDSASEVEFSAAVARFISGELMPCLAPHPSEGGGRADPLLVALSGGMSKRELAFAGKRFEFDPFARRLERMQEAIRQQQFTPLPVLLDIYRLLDDDQNKNTGIPTRYAALAARSREILIIEPPPDSPKSLRQAISQADLGSLRARLDAAAKGHRQAQDLEAVRREMAAALHLELGVTLLSYGYAYHGSPEIDALAFDPHLVRKHAFVDDSRSSSIWTRALLQQSSGLGTYIAGSLSGLDAELAQLEVAQSGRAFAGRVSTLLPIMLSGLRQVPSPLRSDRAQEYVALSIRLGRETLTLSGQEQNSGRWCDEQLALFVPPRRRERMAQLLAQGAPVAAAEMLTPSELYFLGQAYLKTVGDDGGKGPSGHSGFQGTGSAAHPALVFSSPVLDRLRELSRGADASDEVAFRRELEQYGVSLRHRIGLRRFSLEIPEPYEHLEQNQREQLLSERICDLRMRLAELHYSLGLPAWVSEVDGEFALREILPRSADGGSGDWKTALQRIARLRPEHVHGWIEEALNRGDLKPWE